jgi:hypothetical protein
MKKLLIGVLMLGCMNPAMAFWGLFSNSKSEKTHEMLIKDIDQKITILAGNLFPVPGIDHNLLQRITQKRTDLLAVSGIPGYAQAAPLVAAPQPSVVAPQVLHTTTDAHGNMVGHQIHPKEVVVVQAAVTPSIQMPVVPIHEEIKAPIIHQEPEKPVVTPMVVVPVAAKTESTQELHVVKNENGKVEVGTIPGPAKKTPVVSAATSKNPAFAARQAALMGVFGGDKPSIKPSSVPKKPGKWATVEIPNPNETTTTESSSSVVPPLDKIEEDASLETGAPKAPPMAPPMNNGASPPPPPPPGPPSNATKATVASSNTHKVPAGLLDSIRTSKKLKKTVTVDKSQPDLPNNKKEDDKEPEANDLKGILAKALKTRNSKLTTNVSVDPTNTPPSSASTNQATVKKVPPQATPTQVAANQSNNTAGKKVDPDNWDESDE